MKTLVSVVVLLVAFGLLGYGCYRKGYSDATSKAAAYEAQFDDSNFDPAANHSQKYSLGYARGHAVGSVETRRNDFIECQEELARLAVEARNAKVAGKWLAEHHFTPSQLEEAESQYQGRH